MDGNVKVSKLLCIYDDYYVSKKAYDKIVASLRKSGLSFNLVTRDKELVIVWINGQAVLPAHQFKAGKPGYLYGPKFV